MNELNKVIYEQVVYLKVNDLTQVFGASLYKIKNEIKKQGLQTTKLKGFGNGLFISEKQASMLVIDGKSKLFSTKIRTVEEELRTTILLNKMFGTEGSAGESMLQEAIDKFEKIEDYVIEESINDIEVDNDDDEDFNKQFEKENLAFRQVDISLRNTNVSEQSECSISVIVDKDSNIICNTPYTECFELQDDILHLDATEEWTGDVWKDYVKHIPGEYGYDKTQVDVAKILKQIYIGIKDIKVTDFGDWYDIENMEISELELLMLLNNKDTLITGVNY